MKNDMNQVLNFRGKCYACNRPKSSCMCKYTHCINTQTHFIILMHPKEHQKTKNGTGYLTHLSLPNSKVFRGVDFSGHEQINQLINDKNNECFILYPGEKSINLSEHTLPKSNKQRIIFIIDSTWACSRKMLRLSQNLANLPRISFNNSQVSNFQFKRQPANYCLSTIESTQVLLSLLNQQQLETIGQKDLQNFLNPFNEMVKYQVLCAQKRALREENKK